MTAFGLAIVCEALLGILWAASRDPFTREWLTLRATDSRSFSCVIVRARHGHSSGTVFYVPDPATPSAAIGTRVRVMADLGLTVISFEPGVRSSASLADFIGPVLECISTHRDLAAQPKPTWVVEGSSGRAALTYVALHPLRRPAGLVFLPREDGRPVAEATSQGPELARGGIKLLVLAMAFADENLGAARSDLLEVPVRGHERSRAQAVRQLPVQSAATPALLFRLIGEWCVRQTNDIHIEAPPSTTATAGPWSRPRFLYALGAVGVLALLAAGKRALGTRPPSKRLFLGTLAAAGGVLLCNDGLRRLEACPAIPGGLPAWLGERLLVKTTDRTLFRWRMNRPGAPLLSLGEVADEICVIAYNRRISNWSFDDAMFLDYVADPRLGEGRVESGALRRQLWQSCYPRIRKERTVDLAVATLAQYLRSRVSVDARNADPHDRSIEWTEGKTDRMGFRLLMVVALRAVGIPSRLGQGDVVEFQDGVRWRELGTVYETLGNDWP